MSTQEDVNKTDIEWIKEFIRDMRDEHNRKLDRIEEQTTKTNGRVSRLEMWRERATGYTMAISAVVSVIIGAAGVAIHILA